MPSCEQERLAGSLPRLAGEVEFLGPDELDGRPFVGVDGAPPDGASLSLAHWPGVATPPALGAPTATEIVARYLRMGAAGSPELSVMTNGHVDEDGVLAAWTLLARPTQASQDLAIAAARAGDYAVWDDPWAARGAIALQVLTEPATTPLWEVRRALADPRGANPSGPIHRAVLGRVGQVLADPERFEPLWRARWRVVEADVALLDAGEAAITDRPDADAIIVRSPRPLDELALHPRTPRGLVVTALPDGRVLARQRYESWVEFPPGGTEPRVGLGPVAARLDAFDPDASWRAEGPEVARARLFPSDSIGNPIATRLDPDLVVDEVAQERELAGVGRNNH